MSSFQSSNIGLATGAGAAIVAAAFLVAHRLLSRRQRLRGSIAPHDERVLILGASSGVGAALAEAYAARGARVLLVARREVELRALADRCSTPSCLWQVADFSCVEDMTAVRDRLLHEWDGLDTLHVVAGVSALQPILGLARVDVTGSSPRVPLADAPAEDIRHAVSIAGKAMRGNFDGPLIAALTMIPLMARTSPAPAVVLLNSLASVVAAPTRGLYAASKAAALLLYQALAIEHPDVAFTFLLPSTIEGNFRASAVDAGPVREADPNRHGLRRAAVARRCMDVVDYGVVGNIVMPWFPNAFGPHLYYFWPSFVQQQARKKYNFP